MPEPIVPKTDLPPTTEAPAGAVPGAAQGAPAAAPPATPPAAPPPPATAKPVAPAAPPSGAAAPPGDDDDDPAQIRMSKSDLDKRLERAKRSALKDLGYEDPAVIKAKLARADAAEKAEEEAKRAALTEQQRLEADLTRERQAREAAEAKLEAAQEAVEYERENTRITRLADAHIDPDPDVREIVVKKFVAFCGTKTEAEQDAMKDEDIDAWFKEFAGSEKGAKFARAQPAAAAAPLGTAPAAVRKPITSGGNNPANRQPPPPAGTGTAVGAGTKSPAEVVERARARGIGWPGMNRGVNGGQSGPTPPVPAGRPGGSGTAT